MTTPVLFDIPGPKARTRIRIGTGIGMPQACYAAVVSPLSDEPSLVAAMRDLVDATFV